MRHAALLRGINLGPSRRLPMADLRALLTEAGFGDVATYVQSGNVALDSALVPDALAAELTRLIAERFDLDVPVIVRSHDELAAVIAFNPLRDVATEPKRHQVTFLDAPLADEARAALEAAAVEPERVAFGEREVYAWHPAGIARSKLWNALAGKGLGVRGTSRNWTTVLKLAEMTAG